MKNKNLTTIILVIVFTGVGFFGGMKYQQSKVSSFAGGLSNGGQGNFRNGRTG